MMEQKQPLMLEECLNCGSKKIEKYCAHCGQKAQATKQPLKIFVSDTVETLFNIDSRWLRTLKDLFVHPGKVTKEYIKGKRAQYLPPLRVYLSISIIYFLLIQLVDSNQIFFINFSSDDGESSDLGTVIQYALFLLVPLFALYARLFHWKRKAFYVEYLIFSFHIHTIWFVFLMIELLTVWLSTNFEQEWVSIIAMILSVPAQAATYIYLVIYLRKTFSQKWSTAIIKSLGIMILYMLTLGLTTMIYIFGISKLFN